MCPGGFFNLGLTVCAEDGRLGGARAVCAGKRPFATERLQRPKGYAMLELPTGKHPEEKTEVSNMKKLLSILMVCALMLGLFACASTNEDTTTTAAPATPETTAAPTEQPTETTEVVDEMSYEETNVSVPSSTGDYQISAVLTTPNTDEKVPLVAMLHGFAGNKDEGNGFIYIARVLAKHGIASIRMDFAGTGDDTRLFADYTLDSAAADATDCVDYALANANIDETKLGIFGYSNGGRIATMVTAMDSRYQVRALLAPSVSDDTTSVEADLEECAETGYREIEWYGRTIQVSKEYYESWIRFAENLGEYEKTLMPTLVVHGTEDSIAVHPFVETVGADELTLFGANHGYGFYDDNAEGFNTMDTVANAVAGFFAQHFIEEGAAEMFGN